MISTVEFYNNLLVRINREHEAAGEQEGNNKENILTKIMIDDLSSGNNQALRGVNVISRYANASIKCQINGYFFDEIEHNVILYITYFNASNFPYRVLSTELSSKLGALNNFVQKIISNPDYMFNIIQEDNPYYSLLYDIVHSYKDIDYFSYVFLTNGNVGEIKLPSYKVAGKKVDITVYDIERYRRFNEGQKISSIDADLNILGKPIRCASVSCNDDTYDTYCCILPGETIYRLFDSYHYQLLNSNVRTFLQLRGKVNKGIFETIQSNPEYFLAYNNGLSTTASEVCLNAGGDIVKIKDFQIVNGGQTSASIYNAKENKHLDISKISVMAKITVIKDEANYDEIVKSISRYANTQNVVKFSDFSSNDKYNKILASISRTTYTPSFGTKLQTKWYYENIAGSYNNERSDCASTTAFDKEYPKSQYFSKTDMASYELSYQGYPADACKGAQDAYKVFVMNLPDLKEPNKEDFKNLVAKKILYDGVLKIITEEIGGQGKAAIARYVVAYFSTIICQNRFNLKTVWEKQCLTNVMIDDLKYLVIQMHSIIKKKAEQNQKSIEMYCRTPSSWETIKKMRFAVNNSSLYATGELIEPILTTKAIPDSLVAFVLSVVSEGTWMDMSLHTNLINDDEKGQFSNMCKTMAKIKKEDITEKQAAYALKIVYKFYNVGYRFSNPIANEIEEKKDMIEKVISKKTQQYSRAKYYTMAK